MGTWSRLLGRVVLILAVFAAGYLGAKLGLLGTREVGASHNFNDVPPGAFYHAFVEYLAQSGVTAGCGAGQFCPEQAVTRGQMAVFLAQVRLLAGCPPDSVRVASTCVDKYEASVWQTTNAGLVQKIRLGTATLGDLVAAGAVQRGEVADDYGAACPDTGNGCTNLYAVSIPGTTPSRFLTWFQAVAAARNAGKRLPTNAEWQAAALGTPDGAPCVVINAPGPGATGTAGCVSDVGTFDMVGNLFEWVADWVPLSTNCPASLFGSFDQNCLAGASTTGGRVRCFGAGSSAAAAALRPASS